MRTIEQRLDQWCVPEPNTGCLLWDGAYNQRAKYPGHSRPVLNVPEGDGRWRIRNAAHVSYELRHGPIPKGLHVLHTCDVPGCVNPDHLYLGTHADNMADMARRGRAASRPGPPCCPRGHLFTPENTRMKASGKHMQRACRACDAIHNARRPRRGETR